MSASRVDRFYRPYKSELDPDCVARIKAGASTWYKESEFVLYLSLPSTDKTRSFIIFRREAATKEGQSSGRPRTHDVHV